jgi:hypothetical protein
MTSIDKQYKNVTITDEVRKGLDSELRIKKMDTEITKGGYSAMETSVNGTRFDRRKSLDRGTTGLNSENQDYGSVMSPSSPLKNVRGFTSTMPKERGTETKTFDNRRNTTKPVN